MKKIILLFSVFALISERLLSQAFTPFTYQLPKYGSHAINDVKWIHGTQFIAVGEAGAMLLTNDDGQTWQRLTPFTDLHFRKVFVKDSLTLFAIASQEYAYGELYKSVDAGQTWSLLYANQNATFRDIHFPNDSIGYIANYYGTICKTTDGGNTWSESGINSTVGTYFDAICFINSDTGFVGKTTTNAPMFRTENGGLTWTQVYGYLGQACYNIQFLNDTLGYAGAYNGRIHRTTNGGLTWAQLTTFQTNEEVIDMAFSSLTKGVAVTDSYVYRTNNGTTWSGPFNSGFNFRSCAYSPSGTLILGDSYGGLHRASNDGTSYTNVNLLSGFQPYRRIAFIGSQTGWVVGDGYNLLKTSNGGSTWTKLSNAPYCNTVFDMQAISASKVLYITDEGKVISTSNGGTSFSTQTLSTNQWLTAMSFPNANTGYIVGNAGVAFKTTNGGISYTSINTGITVDHVEVHFPSVNTGYVVSSWGELKKTVNGGSSWTSLSPVGMNYIKKMYFINDNYGYLANNTGMVYRTTDGGNTFSSGSQTCLETPFDMQFINDSTGFVVGSYVNAYCDISFTTDSGNTWKSIKLPYAYSGWGIHAIDTANIYFVGQNQTIIRIGTGGVITTLNETKGHVDQVNLFPNPSSDYMQVSSTEAIHHLEVMDVMGRAIRLPYTIDNSTQQAVIQIESLPKGVFFIRLNKHLVRKFSKE